MKKYSLSFFVFLAVFGAIFGLSSHTGESYVRSPLSTGMPSAWNLTNPDPASKVSNGQIVYNLNSAGSDNVPFAQVEQALMASFQTWEDIPTSAIAFSRGPNTNSTATMSNNVLELFWLENSTMTSDGLNIAGALAVTRVTTFTSGQRTGEIIDGATVFNGNQFQWAVDGNPNAADISEVATHEIGHLIGISHSPIGGTTMFPRSGLGRTRARTLEPDDIIAASVAYPVAGFASSTGTIAGRVLDNSGKVIFGAHIAAVDENGNVTSGALSQPDGSYRIQGLPPGNYTIYAEPLDPAANTYYSKSDLTAFYANVVGDFSTSQDLQVSVGGGQQASRDITVMRGNPAFDGNFVFDAANVAFLNVATTVTQGQDNVTVGVAGPGLPQSGDPLSISGPGITILRQFFRTTSSGLPAVLADINVSPTAPAGSRNLIISNGSQRTIVTGGMEIAAGSGPGSTVAVVSSASFANPIAAESIASAFGSNLSSRTEPANSNPLPTSLGGATIRLRDSVGNERLAPLFYVSPTQFNYQIAPGIQVGNISMTITSDTGTATGSFQLAPVAPGLFSANATGQGVAAAVALRVRNGTQTFESIAQVNGSQVTPIPIDLGPATDQIFLVLFATGVRFFSALPTCSVGGANMQVTFAGQAPNLIGLDQINVRLDRSLIGRGAVNVMLNVDGMQSNMVSATIK